MFFHRNGRWRSEWSVSFQPSGGNVEVNGVLKVQVIMHVTWPPFLESLFIRNLTIPTLI